MSRRGKLGTDPIEDKKMRESDNDGTRAIKATLREGEWGSGTCTYTTNNLKGTAGFCPYFKL
jgi:hypothetical protein